LDGFESIIKPSKRDRKQLDGFFSDTLKYNQNETTSVIKLLKTYFIYTLRDLQSLTDEGWKILFNLMPSRADDIREEVEKLDFESPTESLLNTKDEFEQMSDWHKTERFLFHRAKMYDRLNKTGYVNLEALKKSFENERKVKSFNIDPTMLNELEKRFSSFCLADENKIKMNRGLHRV
jgi:hypothetical protein